MNRILPRSVRVLLFAACAPLGLAQTKPFIWVEKDSAASIVLPDDASEPIRRAAADLARDVKTVTGEASGQSQASGIFVFSRDEPGFEASCRKWSVDPGLAPHDPNAFRIFARDSAHLYVLGADELGAIYGIYYLSQNYLGVDPLAKWGSLSPRHKNSISIPLTNHLEPAPRFRWRGWFLNDEDLLTGWKEGSGRRNLMYFYFNRPISLEVYERVFETALRLRCNFIIPGSYIDLESKADNAIVDAAERRGLYVSQHHTQPLGVSAFAFRNYWTKRGREIPFSYAAAPAAFDEVWAHYAELWKRHGKVIWQMGLRGTGDRPFWANDIYAPTNDVGRGQLISQAVRKQWQIVSAGATTPPICTTTFWLEGAELNRQGLVKLPSGVICVFADDGSTQELQEDFFNTPREPGRGYGAYLHAAMWGSGPHLVQGASLERLADNLQLEADRGDTAYFVQNVSNVREFVAEIEAGTRWTGFPGPIDAHAYILSWCRRIYGDAACAACAKLYLEIPKAFPSHPYIQSHSRRYLDGDIRGDGKRLVSTALDRDFSCASVNTSTIPAGVEKALQATTESFQRLLDEANGVEVQIPPDRRQFFRDNILTQLKIEIDLAEWVSSLCSSIHAFGAAEVPKAATLADAAAGHLQACLEARKAAEHDEWVNWYREDSRMNLPALLDDTRALVRRFQLLSNNGFDPSRDAILSATQPLQSPASK